MTREHPLSFRELFRRFAPDVWPLRGRLAGAYLLGLLSVGAALALPWPLKWLIDSILPGAPLPPRLADLGEGLSQLQLAAGAAAAFLVFTAIHAFAGAAQRSVDARTREKLALRFRTRLLDHLIRLSPSLATDYRSGDLVSRLVTDSNLLVRLWAKTGPLLFVHGATVVLTLAAMFWLAPPLGLMGVVVVPLLALIARSFAPRLAAAARRKRAEDGELAGTAQEIVKGLPSLQTAGETGPALARFDEVARRALASGVEATRAALRMERTLRLCQGAVVASALLGGASLVLNGTLSIGTLTVFASYVTQLLKPVEKVNELASAIARGLAAGERLIGILDREVTVNSAVDALPLRRGAGVVTIENAHFRYPDGSSPILDGATFELLPGDLTVLRGASGTGKSTLLQLIARIYDLDQGVIRIDGQAVPEIEIESLRSQLAVLSQRSHFFAGTLREALRVSPEPEPDSRLFEALEWVHLEGFVSGLPDGLDSPLGEDGVNLSGGQHRRLGLARVLLSNRRIVLLDEPTAGIDEISQRIVVSALHQLAKSRTVLAVSHQTSLLEAADTVVELRDGHLHLVHSSRVPLQEGAYR